jgi:hypothetical protein
MKKNEKNMMVKVTSGIDVVGCCVEWSGVECCVVMITE